MTLSLVLIVTVYAVIELPPKNGAVHLIYTYEPFIDVIGATGVSGTCAVKMSIELE